MSMNIEKSKIGIVGMGYVGAPLAVEFGKIREVIGFDVNTDRIKSLSSGVDSTLELSYDEIIEAIHLEFTDNENDLKECDIYIVTVPTPVDLNKKPDLSPLISASKMLGNLIQKNNIVIYESTVYPGATEEVCVPVIEKSSGLKFNVDFFCGYSPERINPGDKENRITSITKVTSGSNPEVALIVDNLYKQIITAGTFMAKSIKVAEAAKVIENTQRDINIALINEFAVIFEKLGIDTESVLNAAGTKWNFLPFKPGLVGGHCIGVDPYYLTYKANAVGYDPEMILAGRKLNDNMGLYIADLVCNKMKLKDINIIDSNILIMGLTFKENCPDIRNTKVIDLFENFASNGCNVDVFDPWVNSGDAQLEYGIELIKYPKPNMYDAIILAVAHYEFKVLGFDKIKSFAKDKSVIYDIKCLFEANHTDGRL
jgi:UDP-N-acetyl-D-glucosamine/UDP-N-acetyl-D-galactosamine dehydrogenase